MENINYKVCRDSVFVGTVIKPSSICRNERDCEYFQAKPGQLYVSSKRDYRNMLFVPTKERLANDLLYNSPNYKVLNMSDDEEILNSKNGIVIEDACNLGELLKYFNYKNELTYNDILKIRQIFFTGRFALDHCELFGWQESWNDSWIYYENLLKSSEALKLSKKRLEEIKEYARSRNFSYIGEAVLPITYWFALDSRDNHEEKDVKQGIYQNIDSFAPVKEEGPIKKLTK